MVWCGACVSSPLCGLAQLSARQTHALCEAVVAYILTGAIDYGAVAELTADLEGGHSDTKGAVAAVHFCLVCARACIAPLVPVLCLSGQALKSCTSPTIC